MNDESIRVMRCQKCSGNPYAASLSVCTMCIDRGWLWSDGVAATLCPETLRGVAFPPPSGWRGAFQISCGRANGECPGCGRAAGAIGGETDQEIMRRSAQKFRDAMKEGITRSYPRR